MKIASAQVKLLSASGITLTLVGAALLFYGEVRPPRASTWNDAKKGFPNPYAWQGFALIAMGSLLQLVAAVAE